MPCVMPVSSRATTVPNSIDQETKEIENNLG